MSTSHATADTGRELGGRYRLVAPIGIGTSSRVFLAIDTQLRRRVAIKLLHASLAADDTFLRRFRAEARAAGALSHPNIVAVYDWGEDETDEGVVPYLVTEYLGGGSLRRVLDRGRPLSPSQALMVGIDTARALAHAHRRGLVHRDVKPANLLFDTEGRLRLADFGLARALAEASWTEPAGTMVGTARYASPEQATGRRLDGHSDVYSLALVMVECVTGAVPGVADTTAGTFATRAAEDMVVPPELGALRGTLERAGRCDPAERIDAEAMDISLLAAAETMPRPEALPLVATLDEAQITTELHLVEGLGAISVVGDRADHGTPDHGTPDQDPSDRVVPLVGNTDETDHDDDDEDVTEGVAILERSPIVVAEEHHLLTASRPASFGRVEPLAADEGGADGAGVEGAAGDELAPFAPVAPTTPSAERRPRRTRRALLWGLAVLVAVALVAGVSWWSFVRVPSTEVPAFVGKDVAAARSAAREHGWHVDDDTVVRRDGTRAGEVVAQSPRAGERLADDGTLRVTVSLGPTLVAVPDVVGRPEAEARAAIEAAGLGVGASTQAPDEQVPAGAVASVGPSPGQEAPAADGTVPKGTEVALVVSTGPAPRSVPAGLPGMVLADARAALANVQLKANVQEQFDEGVPTGIVISADTPAGAQLPRDTAVVLHVSKGPAPVPVPPVVGMSGTAAAATIQAAGLGVSGIEGNPSNGVLATDPPAGEPAPRGSPVRIFTRA